MIADLSYWFLQSIIISPASYLGLIFFDGLESPIHLSIIFAYSWSSQAYENVDFRVTSCEKVLGVHIDDNLTWTSHFQHVSKKISTYLWLLSQIRSYLPIHHRMTFYNAYIKPHLEYCCVIWGNSFNSNVYKIEKLQRRACKLILGKDYTSLEEARMQLNMLSFEELIFINKAKVMFKVTHGLSPIYITEMFQIKGSTNDDTMTLCSDSNKNFKTPKPKLNMFKNSLSYSGAFQHYY